MLVDDTILAKEHCVGNDGNEKDDDLGLSTGDHLDGCLKDSHCNARGENSIVWGEGEYDCSEMRATAESAFSWPEFSSLEPGA
mmetsp:Transcript_102450/g.208571  ORF Transcript_102450/g.208571 Transcript_102450/m.208571 type:complete len:83 (-) Transcript_102450:8-256(-)